MCLNDPLAHVRKPFQKLLERVAVRLDMESRLTHINITAEKLGRSSDDDDVGVRQSDEDRSHIGVRVIRKSRIDVSQKKSKMRKLCASSDCANRLSRGIFSSHPGMLTHSVLSGYGPSVPFARKFPHHSGRIRWLFARRRLTCTATRAWPVTVTRAFLAVEVTAARIEPTAVLRRVLGLRQQHDTGAHTSHGLPGRLGRRRSAQRQRGAQQQCLHESFEHVRVPRLCLCRTPA